VLAAAPTGLPADFAQRIFAGDGVGAALLEARLETAFGAHEENERRLETFEIKRLYRPESLAIVRTIRGDGPVTLQTSFAHRTRGVAIGCGTTSTSRGETSSQKISPQHSSRRSRLRATLLLNVGAHGDLRFCCVYRFRGDQTFCWSSHGRVVPPRLSIGYATIEGWTNLDADEERDNALALALEVMAELARAGDAGPKPRARRRAARRATPGTPIAPTRTSAPPPRLGATRPALLVRGRRARGRAEHQAPSRRPRLCGVGKDEVPDPLAHQYNLLLRVLRKLSVRGLVPQV
jgi:hypothetical protein